MYRWISDGNDYDKTISSPFTSPLVTLFNQNRFCSKVQLDAADGDAFHDPPNGCLDETHRYACEFDCQRRK